MEMKRAESEPGNKERVPSSGNKTFLFSAVQIVRSNGTLHFSASIGLQVMRCYLFQLFRLLEVMGHYIFELLEALLFTAVSFRKLRAHLCLGPRYY